MNEHWTDRLSDYLDGDLSPSERAACETHLAECPECTGTLDELRAIVSQASLLVDAPPARDLWPEVEARLAPRGAGEFSSQATDDGVVVLERRRRRVAFTVPQLIAAAVTLVVVSAGTVRTMLPTATDPPDPASINRSAENRGSAAPLAVTPVRFAGAWDHAIRELEAEFERRRTELDPETIRVVENNLAIIDGAIAEAHSALADDPSSAFLNSHLASAMRQKVDLLRRVTSIERTES